MKKQNNFKKVADWVKPVGTQNRYYRKISKGIYQTGLKSYKASKMVNGVLTTAYATTKKEVLALYKTL